MKLNWGHYIVLVFVCFVILIGFMVYRSFQNNHDLVAENYYEQEIKFQEIIDLKKKTSELEQDVVWKKIDNGILLDFPKVEGKISGVIELMRPSDKMMDLNLQIELTEDGYQLIDAQMLTKGKYLIKIFWQIDQEKYYTEGAAYYI